MQKSTSLNVRPSVCVLYMYFRSAFIWSLWTFISLATNKKIQLNEPFFLSLNNIHKHKHMRIRQPYTQTHSNCSHEWILLDYYCYWANVRSAQRAKTNWNVVWMFISYVKWFEVKKMCNAFSCAHVYTEPFLWPLVSAENCEYIGECIE